MNMLKNNYNPLTSCFFWLGNAIKLGNMVGLYHRIQLYITNIHLYLTINILNGMSNMLENQQQEKKSILDHFVFPQIRDVQKKVLLEMEEALKTFDYIVVEAPTGAGKSPIVTTTALYLGSSYINTASLLLQDQYLRDFKWLRTIKGKSNFECIDPVTEQLKQIRIQEMKMQKSLDGDGETRRLAFIKSLEDKTLGCHEAPCCFKGNYKCTVKPKASDYEIEYEGTIKEKIIEPQLPMFGDSAVPWCHYFNQKNKGMLASHTVMNYKWFFSIYFSNPKEFTERHRELLVFDEAHSIENEIMDFIGFTLSRQYLENLEKNVLNEEVLKHCSINLKDLQLPTENVENIDTWIAFLDKTHIWMDSVYRYYTHLMEDSSKDLDESLISSIETAKTKIEQLVGNMILDKTNWIIDVRSEYYDKTKIKDVRIYPIEAGKYIRPILDIAEKKLFISATILDKEVFCKIIGVHSDKVKFIRINESPFPVENRPIYAWNLGQMSYKNMSSLLPAIASNVDAIMSKYPAQKGIIHTTSYAQCEYIQKHISWTNRDRLLITGGHGVKQSDIIKQHEASDNTVLLSPSLHQGVDLNEDLSRFQIIVKIPFPDLSDKRIALKMKRDYNWYKLQTILRFIQSVGRSVRSESDYADTFVLDSNFKQLANSKMMPQYIRDAVIMR